MPASTRRIYVDANVLLAYLGNETGRAEIVEALLDEARRSEIEIITSVLSIAEVAFGAQERDAGLTPEGEAQIDTLWQPASPITLVDVSQPARREVSSGRRRPRDSPACARWTRCISPRHDCTAPTKSSLTK